MGTDTKGSVGTGIVWIVLISILLFWLPIVGPFIAGLIGGKKSGGIGNALAAVFVPAIVIAVLLFALATSLTGLPLIGAVAGAGALILIGANIGPLLLGAIIGGASA